MDNPLTEKYGCSKPELLAVLLIFIGFIILEIIFTRFFAKPQQNKDDAVVEVIVTISFTTS